MALKYVIKKQHYCLDYSDKFTSVVFGVDNCKQFIRKVFGPNGVSQNRSQSADVVAAGVLFELELAVEHVADPGQHVRVDPG
jgi:hypothetical protein